MNVESLIIRNLRKIFNTARHLKAVQLVHFLRLNFRAQSPVSRPKFEVRTCKSRFAKPIAVKSLNFDACSIRLLNQTREFTDGTIWTDSNIPLLWRYHLHYFDVLNSEQSTETSTLSREMIERWIAENPQWQSPGWDPFPISKRVVNWIKWAAQGNKLSRSSLDSLAVQAVVLHKRLENHLLANHLFVNAKALIFCGIFFEGKASEQWLDTGLRILRAQIPEQILADGGHFERSPMYQASILEDLLDLVNLGQAYGLLETERIEWTRVAMLMLSWLRRLCHPDGEISFFNDATFGVAPKLAALEDYAVRVGEQDKTSLLDSLGEFAEKADDDLAIVYLSDSGYARVVAGPTVSLIDVAPLGPSYQPGHGHADTLSFEVSLHGHRLLVNSGISTYQEGEERLRQRGTLAHNTVSVNCEDSSEVWKSFRVARRARPFDVSVIENGARIRVMGAHDGYRRLRGKPVHRREWVFGRSQIRITDCIEGRFSSAVASFHLHPQVRISRQTESVVLVEIRGEKLARFKCLDGTLEIDETTWHPGFNLSIPNRVIRCSFLSTQVTCELEWIKY